MGNVTVRNISNRPLSLNFDDGTVNIMPRQVSEPIDETKIESDTVASTQLKKYVADKEAVVVPQKQYTKPTETKKSKS